MFEFGDSVFVLPGRSYDHGIMIESIAQVVQTEHINGCGESVVTIRGFDDEYTLITQGIHPSELELVSEDSVELTDEEIQAIDDSTHFHESVDWSLRFARNVLKAAEEKKNG